MKFLLTALILFATAAQAVTPAERAEMDRIKKEALERGARITKERRVNDNWSAFCNVDAVTGVKKCAAGTFAYAMDHEGKPFGTKNYPFQVYFVNNQGPYVMVGLHTFPGRNPTVRVDDGAPVTVGDDGGVSPPVPAPALVDQIRTGLVARARFHSWPKGAQDIYVELTGFEEAWQRLAQLRAQ